MECCCSERDVFDFTDPEHIELTRSKKISRSYQLLQQETDVGSLHVILDPVVRSLDVMNRIRTLVYRVQDEESHRFFVPGCTWWVATLGESHKTNYPDVVHICDQLGIPQSDLIAYFGKRWCYRTEFPFSALSTRKLRCIMFVTVDPISSWSEYGDVSLGPKISKDKKKNTCVKSTTHSTAVARLKNDIYMSSKTLLEKVANSLLLLAAKETALHSTKMPAETNLPRRTTAITPAQMVAEHPRSSYQLPP